MTFDETPLAGSFVISTAPVSDERGRFARTFCDRSFAAAGLECGWVQANRSTTHMAGTVRGLHYQLPPASEIKLVQCVRGRIHDVIVDVRPDSPTYMRHFAIELSGDQPHMVYVPRGFAHGFQTMTDHAEVHYLVSAHHDPERERGLRHDDPALAIHWPHAVTCISPKDRQWPLLPERNVPDGVGRTGQA